MSKVYTKTGDKGRTSLLGGSKVSKASLRIESYGTVDELNSFIGYLHDHSEVPESIKAQLRDVQNDLFTLGSLLAVEKDFSGFELPSLAKTDVSKLEIWIDEFEKDLPTLKNFILPAGHKTVSLCHVCRCVCRRAERAIVGIEDGEGFEEIMLPYVNRLSDYFFVLARKLTQELKVTEVPWAPRM